MNVLDPNTVGNVKNERRVSVRNDCRTFRMGVEVEREREPQRAPADTVILYQDSGSQEVRVPPRHASLPHERLQGEGCYSKTRCITISRCATFDLSSSTTTYGWGSSAKQRAL